MDSDNQLLAAYAREGSEAAFRDLVERHIGMVHCTALREAGGMAALAEDITQEVFTELARRADKVSAHPAIAGWLYTCVRLTAANLRRSESRRQRREQEAFNMEKMLNSNGDDQLWQQMRPVLDDVMHELDEEDRAAVVLRFFEGRSLKEIGEAIGVTENTARMRVERSLDKLQTLLSRRGIRSTAATLAAALAVGTLATVSSGFAATVAAGAIAKAAGTLGNAVASAKVGSALKVKLLAGATATVLVGGLISALFFSRLTSPSQMPAAPGNAAAVVPSSNQPATAALNANTSPTGAVSDSRMAFQLLDAESGEPLADAKLHLFYMFPDGRGKVVNGRTDANGRYTADKPQLPYRNLNFFVTADAHVPLETGWGERRSMPASYTMKLERGVTIGGVVVDESGRPVAGAKIEVQGKGIDSSQTENIEFISDSASISGANGQWFCNMIPRAWDKADLIVSSPEYAETNLTVGPASGDSSRIRIVMSRGFYVAGQVTDLAGNPIAGAKIRQVRMNGERERTASTDAAGNYALKSLAAGEMTVGVQAAGFEPGVRTLQLSDNVPALSFQLGPGQVLRGRIVDDQGKAVAGAFIETTRAPNDKIKWSTNADAAGRFEWNSAPSEPLEYSVLAEGFDQVYAQRLKADGSEHEIKLTKQESRYPVTGEVTDAETARPLDNFKVLVSELEPDWTAPATFITSGHDGKFSFPISKQSSHPGYRVQIEQEGYLPAVSAELAYKDGSQKLEFKLLKGAGPSGVVLLPNGQPAANATALLCTSLSGVTLENGSVVQKGLNTTIYTAQSDANGKFILPGAVDPMGVILIHDEGLADVSLAQLAAGGTVTLKPWGKIEGQVVLDSRPVTNQIVGIGSQVLRYSNAGRRVGYLTYSLDATTDADGRFSIAKVPPGDCYASLPVRVTGYGYSTYRKLVTVTSGATSQIVLGGGGKAVVGKAEFAQTDANNWRDTVVVISEKAEGSPTTAPKRADFTTVAEYAAAFDAYLKDIRSRRTFVAKCNEDGSFRVPDVLPGAYELRIELNDYMKNSATPHDITQKPELLGSVVRRIEVPESDGAMPVDLGTVELTPAPKAN